VAANPYGTDVRCVFDANALWTSTTGLQAVEQDLIHRLLTDNVLGPGGDGWGYDVRKLLGMPAYLGLETSNAPPFSEFAFASDAPQHAGIFLMFLYKIGGVIFL
jgi:hypothetical protein